MSTANHVSGTPAFNHLLHWMLVLVAFTLPLPGRIPVPFLSVLLLIWLAELVVAAVRSRSLAFIPQRWREAGNRRVTLVFFLLILIYILGIFWSDDPGAARFELEKKSMLLLFPFMVFTFPGGVANQHLLTRAFTGFLAGLGVVSLWSVATAVIQWYQSGDTSVLFYAKLADPQHPSYLSMYACFAMAITYLFFIRIDKPLLFRVLMAILLLWWIGFNFLLSSRAGILIMGGVLLLILIRWMRQVRVRVWLPVLALILVTITALFTLNGSPVRARLGAIGNITMKAEEMHGIRKPDGVVVRILGWKVAAEQIRAKPWLGTGTGDYHHDTRIKLEQHNLIEPFGGFRNSHNQFLQTTATLGVIGLMALLLWLLMPPLTLGHKRPWIYGVFLMIIIPNLAFESMLEVQAGILFITYFQVVLFRTSGKLESGVLSA